MKHVFTIIVLFVTLSVSAQPNPTKKAQKFADEMTEVLSLNKDESKAVYEIQLNRIKESNAIKKEYSNNEEVRKEKLRMNGNKVYNQMKKLLGKERQEQWKTYKSKN